jgi:signal transduction histidine kinase
MRDYSVVGIIIGICITIWGAVITHQAKKERDGDGKMPDLLATVIDEQNKKREGIK